MSRDIVVGGLSLLLVASVGEAATGQSDSIAKSSFDTAVYSDAQTAEVIELARIHHRHGSTLWASPSSPVHFDVVFRISMN